MRYFYAGFISLGLLADCFGQIEFPRISPRATVIQHVGLSTITVAYSRPTAGGRKIIGGLFPYRRIWRVGANESTKITFSDSVTIAGAVLPPATYALYAIPDAKRWTVIIHKNITHWGDGRSNYKPEEDALRFTVMPRSIPLFTENFTIEFDSITHNGVTLLWSWENTQISFPVRVNTRQQMLKRIAMQLQNNPTGMTYYEAARYLQEENFFLDSALTYLDNALSVLGDTYFIHRVWALVDAQAGRYDEAIRHASLSKTLAAKEGKDEFVRMNEVSVQEWSSLKK